MTDSPNVELVRSIYARWERGDFSAAEWADREIEFVRADGLELGTWKGPDALAEVTRHILSAWEGYRIVVDEYRELDDERVLVLVHPTGRVKASGLELEQLRSKGAAMFHIRDGKVTKQVMWGNRETALADLGLV